MGSKRSHRSQKKQAKLTFSPLPASANTGTDVAPQARGKPAAVRFEMDGSTSRPKKKRKVAAKADSEEEDDELPEPPSHPIPNTFFPTSAMDDSEQEDANADGWRFGTTQANPRGMFGSSELQELASSSNSSESADEERKPWTTPSVSKRKKDKSKKSKRRSRKAAPESSLEEVVSPIKIGSAKKPVVMSSEEDVHDDDMPRAGQRQAQPDVDLTRDESSDSGTMPDTTPPPRRRRLLNRSARKRSPSFEVSDKDEEEEEILPRGKKRRASPSDEESDEEEVQARSPRKRLMRKPAPRTLDFQEQEDLEEDLEFLKSSPQERKEKPRPKLNPRQKALEELKRRRQAGNAEPSSSAPAAALRTINLDSDSGDEENASEENEPIVSDKDEEDYEDEDENADTDAGDADGGPDVFEEDEDDKRFITDDEEEVLGVPAESDRMPIQFSSFSRSKPKEFFKCVVEWMVQKKLNPGFDSGNEYYLFSFDKLEKELEGLASSKFQSSVWRPEFVYALRARPDMAVMELPPSTRDVMSQDCEACNRKGHPASFTIQLTGSPYNPETLEPLKEDSDEDDDSLSSSSSDSDSSSSSDSESSSNTHTRKAKAKGKKKEKKTRDHRGNILPPSTRIFVVGRTCKTNAEMTHILQHWRIHLYSWVVDYLVSKGHCTPEKIVKRDSMSQRKREKYALKVLDKMENSGEIGRLHSMYKAQIRFAEEMKNDRGRWVR